jgi:pimeloyl-ACP methyl ester carboxylesterase
LLIAGMTSPARAQTSPHRYVVFLAGLCPWTNSDPYCHGQIDAGVRARATFRTLIAAMQAAHLSYTPLYFSYAAAGSAYTVKQTHESVGASAALLTADIRAVRAQDPDASFVLIGHSLGGVVAARWASTHRFTPAASIVTFDSPLRGIRGGSALAQVFGGDVWKSLQPGSASIRAITAQPATWWRTTAHLHTVANRADILVPPSEALLGEGHAVADTACPRDLLFMRSCHGAVLSDGALNAWVVTRWIAPVFSSTPSPTSTPTP